MSKVERVYVTDTAFVAEIIVDGCRLVFTVSIDDMRSGSSLVIEKNKWVKQVLASNGVFISRRSLTDTAKEMTVILRDLIESYFVEETCVADD